MTHHDIITFGASAGGVEALMQLIPDLPRDLPAAVFVVVHRSGESFDYLPELLQRKADIAVVRAFDGEMCRPGYVYVAPPQSHLFLSGGYLRVQRGSSRSSIDALFRSAALAYGERVVAVLLSGMREDGTAGLWDVRRSGGIAIVQDPSDAEHASMPMRAMQEVPVHYCLPISEIVPRLVQLCQARREVMRGARVLIAEDERIVAMNLENRLRDMGYEVIASVASGEEAICTVARAEPDVVLMDVQLSRMMKGTEAARILWEQHRVPVVYLTAYSDEQTLREASAAMPYGFIVKPYRMSQVHAALQLALERRQRENSSGFLATV